MCGPKLTWSDFTGPFPETNDARLIVKYNDCWFQEQYVPTRQGRLPMSAYKRNGIQDQIHGYRGAVRFLCTRENCEGCCVHTAVQPLRRLYPRITQEMLPVKRKKRF